MRGTVLNQTFIINEESVGQREVCFYLFIRKKNLRKVLVVWKKVCTFATANRKTRVCNTKKDALVAQLVEHLTLNQRVQGSSPCRRTKRETHQGFLSFFLSDFTRMGVWSSRSRRLHRLFFKPRITRISRIFFVQQISQIAQIVF